MSPARTPSTDSTDRTARPPNSRRRFLATAATALTGALEGCQSLGADRVAAANPGPWLSFGNGPANANRVRGGAPHPRASTILEPAPWRYAPPVVHDGVAFFAANRRVTAVTTDGETVWDRGVEGEVSGAPAVDSTRNRLVVPTRGRDTGWAGLELRSLADGTRLARYAVGENRTYGVTIDGPDSFVRSANACRRIGPRGTTRWHRDLEPLVYDEYRLGDTAATQIAPAVTDDGVYVPDRDALLKLDRETGDEQWRVGVDTPFAAPTVGPDVVVQTGWQETVAVDPGGDVLWRRDLQSLATPGLGEETAYVAASDLHAVDLTTGETEWTGHTPTDGTASPVVTDDSVVVATGDVRAFRRDTGGLVPRDRERWRYGDVHAPAYATPVIAAGSIFVVGPSGLVALDVDATR